VPFQNGLVVPGRKRRVTRSRYLPAYAVYVMPIWMLRSRSTCVNSPQADHTLRPAWSISPAAYAISVYSAHCHQAVALVFWLISIQPCMSHPIVSPHTVSGPLFAPDAAVEAPIIRFEFNGRSTLAMAA